MFTQQQYESHVGDLTVRDAVVALQTIQRLTRSGAMDERELLPLGILRTNLVKSVMQTTGVNYDLPQKMASETQTNTPEA